MNSKYELAGVARTSTSGIAWLLESDCQLTVYVSRQGSEQSKKLMCFANICHALTSERGLGELSLTDHEVTAMLAEDLFGVLMLYKAT